MTASPAGAVVGLGLALGVVLVVARVRALRTPDLADRVLRHVPDLPGPAPLAFGAAPWRDQVLGPVLTTLGSRLERSLGGAASVRRRLARLGSGQSLPQFRREQARSGLAVMAVATLGGAALVAVDPGRLVPAVVTVLCGFLAGALWRDHRLTRDVARHERLVLLELPAAAELLALSVAAGEGAVAALERVVARSRGALSTELASVLAQVRTGRSLTSALDAYAGRTGVPAVARFARAVAVAMERGTPLADVLHAQVGDVREAQRRALIESAARREIAMMVPVVFLVLPTVVAFALWPGVAGLRLVSP